MLAVAGSRLRDRLRAAFGPLTWGRLALRLTVAVAALAVADAWAAGVVGMSDVSGAYRLPRRSPASYLPALAHRLDAEAARGASASRRVVFLGASPTYGYRVRDGAHTFSAAYGRAAREAGERVTTYNAACNGQFLGDEYVLARRLVDDADTFFVQITYDTFNPRHRDGKAMRFPELVPGLGVLLTAEEAAELGVDEPPPLGLDPALASAVGRRWFAFGARDALVARLFGATPRDALHDAWLRARGRPVPDRDDGDPVDDGSASFEALDPDKQIIALGRYAEDASFTVSPHDSEMRALGRMVRLFSAEGKRAVFYMGPLNRDAIDGFGLLDRAQYEANVAAIRAVVEGGGFALIDHNTGEAVLEPAMFADISHTTDAGGDAVGRLLFEETHRVREAGGAGAAAVSP